MAKQRGPYLANIDPFLAAGVNPKTGLPYAFDGNKTTLKYDIRKTLRILDEQNAINRFVWYNLPNGLDGQLLERILYYKGQGAFFFMETDGRFYFLPYALDGSIDVYGRFKGITPLPFHGTSSDAEEKAWITGLRKTPVYDLSEDITEETFLEGCVLLGDYSKQVSQTNISRQLLQEPILDMMAEAFPMARTSLLANSGIKGLRVNDEDQQSQVKLASQSITNAALTGDPWVPVVGNLEFQDLTSAGSAIKAEEYLLYMQALDNFRLSLYGLKNGGLFQKKAHLLEAEQEMNDGNLGLVLQDSLELRQDFCDKVNAIWGLGIWCEPSETILGMDRNMDGMAADTQDQSGNMAGTQPDVAGGEE